MKLHVRLEDVWNDHGFVEKHFGSRRSAIHVARLTMFFFFSTEEAYSGILEWANFRNFWRCDYVHVNVQRHYWIKKDNAETGVAQWQHLRPNTSQDTRVSKGPASENTWWHGTSNKPQEKSILSQSHYRLDKWGNEEEITTAKEHTRTRRFSSRPCWQATMCLQFNLPVVWYRKYTEKIGRRRKTRSRFRAVDTNYAKKAENASSSRRLVATTTHWESRDADSQSFRTGRNCQNGGNWKVLCYQRICYGWKQFYSFVQRVLRTKEFSRSKVDKKFVTISSGRIGPLTGIEKFQFGATLVVEYRYDNQGNS